jgi:hypothetical protein
MVTRRALSTAVQGMSQVQQVGSDLHLAAFLCKAARHKLAASKNALGRTCFSVLSNYRRTCITEQVPPARPPCVEFGANCAHAHYR